MNNDAPLYNSRITKNYLEYIGKHYPDISVDEILTCAGMTKFEVQDPGHWFSQHQIDRFHEIVIAKTGNPFIFRDVGRYITSSEGLGPVKQHVLGLLNPMSAYLLMSKTYSMFSRGAEIKSKKSGPSTVEITSTPKPGVKESPFQCENRYGSFESLAKMFTKGIAKIEHPFCFHKGDENCRYIVSWENPASLIWKRIFNYSLLMSILVAVTLFFFLPARTWGGIISLIVFMGMILFVVYNFLEKKELIKKLESQGNTAEDLFEEMNIRHNNAALVQEIGQATSTILDIDKIIKKVINLMEKWLDFDRGMIALSNEEKTRLIYCEGYGYDQNQEQLLRQTMFHLDKPESQGIFVLAFKLQEPRIVDRVEDMASNLSERSLEFAKQIGVKSLLCVPIVYENESLGIIAVDNVNSKRPNTKSDVSLLMGVASQTAISIANAMSFTKLQESEKKYRELVEDANSIILRRDIEGKITFFNEYAQKLFGYKEHEIIGRNIIGTILPDSEPIKQRIKRLTKSFLEYPKHPFISEDKNVLRNGEWVWIAWTYRPILNADGDFREILCIGNNITELKKAEQEKKELQVRLQRAQKMEAIGTLAGGVAHDLNNILTGIVSYPELLLMSLPEASSLRKPISTIQKSGEKAAAIVQDLLTLARRGVSTTTVVNLNTLITEYLESPEFKNLKSDHYYVQLTTHFGQDLFNIMGSPVHLAKTIMNLVINAAEAMPNGGDITISTKNCYIDKPIRGYDEVEEGDYVTLTVSDTGVGISSDDLERIFEPFYTKKIMGKSGTGLGMAVVWGTVKDHSGYIDIFSKEGNGTTITLYFPVTRKEIETKDFTESIVDYQGRGESLLVVDDVSEQREIASTILNKLGYVTYSVSSGEEAIEYVKNHSVDLLILDMIMEPGIDGYETYKRILKFRPNQKAIIVSGFSDTQRVNTALELGAGAYVKKPYLLNTIGRAVRSELDRKQQYLAKKTR